MTKQNNYKPKTKKSNRSGRSPMANGDIPVRPKRTYSTTSCRLPKVTEMTTVRAQQFTTVGALAAATQAPTYYFALSNFNVGTGFYDQYRIDAIRFSIVPQNNAVGLVTNSTTTLVDVYCVIDYDDASGLIGPATASAYSNCIILHPGESLERTFQPRMAVAAYSGAFTSYANTEPLWIDAASTGVQHFGIKLWIPAAAAAQTLLQTWDITIEAFVTMRKAI